MRISGAAGQFGSLRGLRWWRSGPFVPDVVHFGALGPVRVAASSASVAVSAVRGGLGVHSGFASGLGNPIHVLN